MIRYCDIHLYADDAKISFSYKNNADHIQLQSDIDHLLQWCNNNSLTLNSKKGKAMTFARVKNTFKNDYFISNSKLERVNYFVDLGVIFDPKLDFRMHIDSITAKASIRLGMIKRWSKEFSDPYVTKSLFIGLVRSVLEYGCQVWCPYYACHIARIESVQKQFLIFALRHLNWDNRLHLPPYRSRLMLIGLNTLEDRRSSLNATFIFKLLKGEISSPHLLSLLKINVPLRQSRNFKILRTNESTLNYLNNEPFSQLCKQFNTYTSFVDFNLSSYKFKKELLLYNRLRH